jgi:hypothetical protein
MNAAAWKRYRLLLLLVAVLGTLWSVAASTPLGRASTWERWSNPGDLSAAHAFLKDDCAACHEPVKGVTADRCVVCHVDSPVLQREPTAFHATVRSCRECHREHQGLGMRPTEMDHGALARLELGRLAIPEMKLKNRPSEERVRRLLAEEGNGPHPGVTRREAALNCTACHQTRDRHQGLFGSDCAQCHRVDKWTIPEFRHPSSQSTECAQCHQAPPSHFMGHFHMISKRVSGQPHADVRQCFLCHQTTAWNDIKGVGWYKHH